MTVPCPPPTASPPARSYRRTWRLVSAGGLAAALTLACAPAASAHVRVHADSTAAGSFAALTFRVPTESDTASTTEVEVQLPTDTPLLYVSYRPVAGWKATITEAPLAKPTTVEGTTVTKAPSSVTWTATDEAAAIAPGQYQEFSISAGPLPGPGTLSLPATQTYSDGKVVHWDQPTPASGDEPENPAPTLEVTAADSSGGMGGMGGSTSATPTAAPVAAASTGSDGTARGLSGAALVVALGALVTGVLALRRRRTAT